MPLTDLYESACLRNAGFMSRMVQAPIGQPPPIPGHNRHWASGCDRRWRSPRPTGMRLSALWKLPTLPGTGERVGGAFIFMVSDDKLGGQVLNLKIRDVAALQRFSSENDWYGQDVPDVGLVQLEITGMPFLELATEDFSFKTGDGDSHNGVPAGHATSDIPRQGESAWSLHTSWDRQQRISIFESSATWVHHRHHAAGWFQWLPDLCRRFPARRRYDVGRRTRAESWHNRRSMSADPTRSNTNISIAEPADIIKGAPYQLATARGGGSPTLETKRQREWKGRSAAEGCTSAARKPGDTPCGREGRSSP